MFVHASFVFIPVFSFLFLARLFRFFILFFDEQKKKKKKTQTNKNKKKNREIKRKGLRETKSALVPQKEK